MNGVNTSAATINKDSAGAVDIGGEFTALAVTDVGFCLYRSVETLTRCIGVEVDGGCGRNDEDAK